MHGVYVDKDGKRCFSGDVNEAELKWHWDETTRVVICLDDTDWQIQLDNELPQPIKQGWPMKIPAGTWHRLIKGTGPITFEITSLVVL